MRHLKADEHRRMAWKNGGGETIEVAVHPPDAGLAGFDWRVSMATVASDGPFSVFPGIDRTLAILAGRGMDLAIEGHGHHRLTAASDPLFFPADAPTTARLVDGPITDLNVMTRRGVLTHRVKRLGAEPHEARGRWILLLAGDDAAIAVEGRTVALDRFDALALSGKVAIGGRDENHPAAIFAVEIDAVL